MKKFKENVPVIILGMSANGLSVARSLGRKGIPVIGVGAMPDEPGFYSRYVKEKHIVPRSMYDEKTFTQFLLSLIKDHDDKPVLFPASDEYIAVISRNRDELLPYFRFMLPSPETVEAFLDKEKTYRLTQAYHIPFPHTYFIHNESELEGIMSAVVYPAIIKPRFSHIWREKHGEVKVLIVRSPDELRKLFHEVTAEQTGVIIQEIIPGSDDNIYVCMAYCAEDSSVLGYITGRKLRQYPPHFGVGCLTESIRMPDLIDSTKKILSNLKYRGMIGIEFKLDSRTNTMVFIEVNMRILLTGELSIAAGVDLPYIAYRHMVYHENTVRSGTFKEGVKLLNLQADIGSLFRYWKAGEMSLRQWIHGFKAHKRAHTYFHLDDLKPFFKVYLSLLFLAIKKTTYSLVNLILFKKR